MTGRARIAASPIAPELSTIALLAARYGGRPIIPVEEVRADFFGHLTDGMFARKIAAGDIRLPIIRIEDSQKSPRYVSLRSLAAYLDERDREAAENLRTRTGQS